MILVDEIKSYKIKSYEIINLLKLDFNDIKSDTNNFKRNMNDIC